MKQTIFDLDEARQKRDQGIKQVSDNNERFLNEARKTAKWLAQGGGKITMDDVREHCPLEPLHPNAFGSVFRHDDFVFTGQYRQSKAVSRRGGMQRVWRLR
ncbi:MAG: hypothetical protein GY938_13350 [Ketobacter sp.]|nr:hypothetical protein [Ketobacter sp.]